ncbi:tryptophan synthase beta subunit-like PLP-dependent enzyme [Xylariales sp. AK1849]|nr:tryptophan synthase beta subunit-like PLP-dependent enzyme [Xylariales sp. AK1849]
MASYLHGPDPQPQKLWMNTPLIPSTTMSQAAGCNIFLKLENLQPSGSFKSRGVGNMILRAMQFKPESQAHFYCSSGGNAGLACATAAVTLRQPCTIVMPLTTSEHMVAKLRLLGAEVRQVGEHWAAADLHLREELLAHDPSGVYVPPFDHPHIWEGASSIVVESVHQMKHLGVEPDGIVCNCGGGGLLNGIMEGVEQTKHLLGLKPRVIAVETVGADSLNASVKAGKLVTLPAITSIATSLGAPTVSKQTFEWSKADHLTSVVVTDAEAVMGSVKLANDARLLVEVACGATIATVYNGMLRRNLGKDSTDEEWSKKNVVVIVCGGSNVTLEILKGYQEKFGVP